MPQTRIEGSNTLAGGVPAGRRSPRPAHLLPSLRYCFKTLGEVIVTGDHMGARATFLQPKDQPGRVLLLRRGQWVNCPPHALWIYEDLIRQAGVANDL